MKCLLRFAFMWMTDLLVSNLGITEIHNIGVFDLLEEFGNEMGDNLEIEQQTRSSANDPNESLLQIVGNFVHILAKKLSKSKMIKFGKS